MPKGDKPHYTLWAAGDSGKGKAGAAWRNDDGSISIVLDPYTVLRGRGHAGAPQTIMLYEAGGYEERKKNKEPKQPPADIPEDDIPF